MTKRAILYARVSGDDRKNATSSIQAQLADCRQYAEQRAYRIVGQAVEEPNKATSGADWLPELERVVSLAPTRTFDVLVVREVDRLARNRFNQMATEIELERHGVIVEYAVGGFDDTDEGRLLKGLVSEFAEYERGKIRRRTQAGKLRSVQSGNVTSGEVAPYGYTLVTETDPTTGKARRALEINPPEAAVVWQIFKMYAEGGTISGICDWLTRHSILKPGKGAAHSARSDGRAMWSLSTLRSILVNETYRGVWAFNKTKSSKHPKTGKRRNLPRPRDEWIEIAVPRIVTDELFEAVQQQRADSKRLTGHQHKHTYALGGMLICARCGRAMVGMPHQNGQRYYRCAKDQQPKHNGGKCGGKMYRCDVVEAAVWQWIKSLLLEPDALRRALEEYQEQQRDRVQPQLAMLESSQTRLGELEGRKERLIAAYTTGVLSLDELAAQKASLDKDIADLGQAIASLKAESETQLLSPEQIEDIETVADETRIRVGADAADNDPTTQRTIFQLLRAQVTLSYDGERRWADASCVLGDTRCTAEYITTPRTTASSCRRG